MNDTTKKIILCLVTCCLTGPTDLLAGKRKEREETDTYAQSYPLHHAISYGNAQAALMLVAQGMPVDEQDSDGNTPLHLTCIAFKGAIQRKVSIQAWLLLIKKIVASSNMGSVQALMHNEDLMQLPPYAQSILVSYFNQYKTYLSSNGSNA